jgi:O-antigen ligase
MINSNLYSMIGMTIACCALYLLYRVWEEKGKRWFLLFALAVGIVVTVAGQSRASILVVAGGIVAVLIFAAKCGRLNKRVARTTVAVCCILIVGAGLFVALQGDAAEDGTKPSVIERFLPEGDDINSYSSGRIVLWSFCAEHLTIAGNDFDQMDLSSFGVGHAHNNFLEYGIRSGVFVAGIFTLAELIAVILAMQYLFSGRRSRDYMLFCVMFALAYLLESLVDVATIPMERYAPFVFYLMLAGMAGRSANSHRPAGRYRGKH